MEDDKLQKTVTFKYDRTKGGDEAANYAKAYIDSLGYGAVLSVINDECICTYTTSGSPETLNDIFTQILGGKNTAKYASEAQFMTLRTMKHYRDHLDLSALLLGTNAETPVYYRVAANNGNLIKEFSYSSSENTAQSDLSTIRDGYALLQLKGTDIDVAFNITSPNISDIIFCSVISGILVLIAVAAIFILRSRQLAAPSLGSGSSHASLGGGHSDLAVKKKSSVNLKKK